MAFRGWGLLLAAMVIGGQPTLLARPVGRGRTRVRAPVVRFEVVRLGQAMQVRVGGLGTDPVVVLAPQDSGWVADLTATSRRAALLAPQQLQLPDLGFADLRLEGDGGRFRLSLRPPEDGELPEPEVSSDGQWLNFRFAATAPAQQIGADADGSAAGSEAQTRVVPPLRQRAIAPPLGDMAVSDITMAGDIVTLPSDGKVDRLVLRQAPAREVLISLATMGGYNTAYFPSEDDEGEGPLVSLNLSDYSLQDAVNLVLQQARWKGKVMKNTLLFGRQMPLGLSPRLSRTIRINQARPSGVVHYLVSLGAASNGVISVTTDHAGTGEGENSSVQQFSDGSAGAAREVINPLVGSGPLEGLQVGGDTRLSTVTLIGDQALVEMAEQYIRQMDLRKRQVAVKMQILDVDLNDVTEINNNFAIRIGDSYLHSNAGSVSAIFGKYYSKAADGLANIALQSGNETLNLLDKNVLNDYLTAKITSTNTKTIANPTLLIQEGHEAMVEVGESVVTAISTSVSESGTTTCELKKEVAGLVLRAGIDRVDDNGFVTLSIAPEVNAKVIDEPGQVAGNCGRYFNINKRSLSTGAFRVRDGQTIVLTGVIQEKDIETVTKWPLLGDIPLVGQFFRGSGSSREKSELVIVITPRIIDDQAGGTYAYTSEPSSNRERQVIHRP